MFPLLYSTACMPCSGGGGWGGVIFEKFQILNQPLVADSMLDECPSSINRKERLVLFQNWFPICLALALALATCCGDKILLQRQRFSRFSQKLSNTQEQAIRRCDVLCALTRCWPRGYTRGDQSLRRVAAVCCCNQQSSNLYIRTDLSPRRVAATWLSPNVHKYNHEL